MNKQPDSTSSDGEVLPENPRNLPMQKKFRVEEDDPDAQKVAAFVRMNKDAIMASVFKDEGLWNWIENNPDRSVIYQIEMEEFTIQVTIHWNTKTKEAEVYACGMNTEWMNERETKIANLFPSRNASAKEITERLGIIPNQELSITNAEFNSDDIRDGLGRGLDVQIIELVRILNIVGIKTTMSCAGHPKNKDGGNARLPFIAVKWDSLQNFMNAIAGWKGVENLIFFNVGLGTIYCTFPEGTPLKKAQRIFGELTDFLAEKIHQAHESTLTPIEIQQRLRRRYQHQLLRKGQM